MRRFLFVGPSLPDAAAVTAGSGIVVLPPIRAGELLRLPVRRGDVVGIVDGFFHQVPAVRHKEILALLADGVGVLGAASIGALRAAELQRYGMVGVGDIFAAFAEQRIEADDEVALVHSPADDGYRPLSEPLANIRATLAHAVASDCCTAATAERILALLAAVPYRARSFRAVGEAGRRIGMGDAAAAALVRFCRANRVDRKRADALALVAALREWDGGGAAPTWRLHRTMYLSSWQLTAAGLRSPTTAGEAPDDAVGDLSVLRACQVLAADFPARYEQWLVDWVSRHCARHCGSPAAADPRAGAVAHGAHRGLYELPPRDGDLGFLDHWLTAGERRHQDVTAQLTRFLVRSFRVGPGIAPDELAVRAARQLPGFATARDLVRRARRLNAEAATVRDGFAASAIATSAVVDWLADRLAVPVPELELAAADRGFESRADLVAAARPLYLLGRVADPRFTMGAAVIDAVP